MKKGILSIAFSLACWQPVEPDNQYQKLEIPLWYAHAYQEVLNCGKDFLSIKAPYMFDKIDFYVSDVDTFTVKGIRAVAFSTGWDIFLTRSVVDSLRIVKHEMMHVATQIYSGHPIQPFYTCKLMWGQ